MYDEFRISTNLLNWYNTPSKKQHHAETSAINESEVRPDNGTIYWQCGSGCHCLMRLLEIGQHAFGGCGGRMHRGNVDSSSSLLLMLLDKIV